MIRLKRLYAHDFKQLKEIELVFPEVGRILVQGKNEAGKSTLFEAIYFALFAQALTTESAGRALEDLIGYEKEKARVELDLAVGERQFKIMRTLRRGKPNVWELDIVHPDGRTDPVRGNRAVNDRLVAELGFDAEALLNTCFVEQKKLEKLEGMSKAKREESLAKLLNLERLLELERKLELRGEDEKLITRLQHRVELAGAQTELPGVEDELLTAEGQLKLLDLRAQVQRALGERRAAGQLNAELEGMRTRREELRAAVTRLDALDRACQSMDAALDRFDVMTQDDEQVAALNEERRAIETAVNDNLPSLETRQQAIRRLGLQVNRLTRVESARGSALLELQRAQSAQHELDAHLERGKGLNETIQAHRTRLADLDSLLRSYEIGEALGEWAVAATEVAEGDESDAGLAQRQNERDILSARQQRDLYALGALVIGIVLVSTLLLPALALATGNLIVAVILALALAALATVVGIALAGRLMANARENTHLTREIGKLEGAAAAKRTLSTRAHERLETAASRLRELGVPLPASPAFAQARRVEIAGTLENKTRAELEQELQALREKLNYAQAQRDEVAKRVGDSTSSIVGVNLARCERVIGRSERILNRWRPVLARRAADLDLAAETEALRDAFRAAQADIKLWQSRIQQSTKIESDLARIEQRLAKTRRELEAQFVQASALLNGQAPGWDPALKRESYLELQERLRREFATLGGERLRSEVSLFENRYGASEREASLRDQRAQEAIAAALRIEQELGIEDGLSPAPSLQELEELDARFDKVNLQDRTRLEARVKHLIERAGELRSIRDRFERELGLVGEAVNPEQAEADLERERRVQLQRKYGAEIAERARRRIVQQVLPATMEYMRRILPQLTRDRYHDAELDPESYRIKVWDERAGQSGAWKEKNIFSGGTKDQFSLALRLAFALATLPQERGASPGFIFLDEPLGSFDEERAGALLYLLTEGEIGRAFDQIFLISHVPVQESKFTHKVRLEHGVVAETSLRPGTRTLEE